MMITFKVVKEDHGWAIRIGERMTTPFRSKDVAVREANCLANAIRCHGARAEVIVEDTDANEALTKDEGACSARLDTMLNEC